MDMIWRGWLGVLVGVIAAADVAAAENLGIGTSPQGTVTYSIGAAIAKIAVQKAGLTMRVQP